MIANFIRPALVVLLLLVVSAPALAAAGDEVVFEGRFDPADLIWDQDARGDMIPVLPGTRPLGQPGLPQLPGQDLLLLVPAELTVADAWIEPLATHREKSPAPLAALCKRLDRGR